MAKGKVAKQVAFAAKAGPASQADEGLYRGFVPDPAALAEVPIEPRLDCSEAALGSDKELWLIQLPLELDPSKPVQWKMDRSGGLEGLRAHCSVDGRSYEMVPEREATCVPLYVTPSGSSGRLPRVDRRLTVLRTTDAPQICFGAAHKEAEPQPPSPDKLPAGDQAALAKKSTKKAKLQPAAPAAPIISEPRQAVPPAAAEAMPNKSNMTAYGGGAQQQQSAAVAAGAGEAADGEGKKKKKKKRREGEEGILGGDGGGEKSPEKSAKKAKKEKKEKKKEKKGDKH